MGGGSQRRARCAATILISRLSAYASAPVLCWRLVQIEAAVCKPALAASKPFSLGHSHTE